MPSAADRGPARRGTIWLSALPLGDGPEADEPLGHALAALDAQWVFLAATAVAGHEERLRQFARVFRALPAWPAGPQGPSADPHSLPFGVAIRTSGDAAQTYLEIANDSPYPIRLACRLERRHRGGRRPRTRSPPGTDTRGRRPQPGPGLSPLRRLRDPDWSAAASRSPR